MEAMWEKKKAMAIKKINLLMENKEKKFNPLLNFTLTKVLSKVAPQFYTEQELAQIEEIGQSYCQAMKDSTQVKINNKERCQSSDEGSMPYGERRVKPKSTEKREPKKQDKEIISSSPPPKLPTLIENKIKELNGRDIRYIMCKKLYPLDIDKDLNCLSMPITKEKLDFLLDIEKEILEDKKHKSDDLKVVMLDPCFREFTMSLRKWYMGTSTSSVYNLVQNWKVVLEKNTFEIGQLLNIWSFRDVNNKLYFVLDDKNSLITDIALHSTQAALGIEGSAKLENSVDREPNNIEESNKKQKGEESR
jgi:hypothetical protein